MAKLKIFNLVSSAHGSNSRNNLSYADTIIDRYGFQYAYDFFEANAHDDIKFFFKIYLKIRAKEKLKELFGTRIHTESYGEMIVKLREEKNVFVRSQKYDKAKACLDKERLLSFLQNN